MLSDSDDDDNDDDDDDDDGGANDHCARVACRYPGIRWSNRGSSDGGSSLDFCHACALALSVQRRVITFHSALQPSNNSSSVAWYCDHVSPCCQRIGDDGKKAYTGTRWTAPWRNNSYDLCDACAYYFSTEAMKPFTNEFAK